MSNNKYFGVRFLQGASNEIDTLGFYPCVGHAYRPSNEAFQMSIMYKNHAGKTFNIQIRVNGFRGLTTNGGLDYPTTVISCDSWEIIKKSEL